MNLGLWLTLITSMPSAVNTYNHNIIKRQGQSTSYNGFGLLLLLEQLLQTVDYEIVKAIQIDRYGNTLGKVPELTNIS